MPKIQSVPIFTKERRRRALADRLRNFSQQTQPFENYRGRIVPQYTIGQGLTKLASGLLGAYAERKAGEAEQQVVDEKRLALADALGQPRTQELQVNDVEGGEPFRRTLEPMMTQDQQQLQGLIDTMSPQELAAARVERLQQLMTPEQAPAPLQVSPGETLVDPRTMQPLYQGPAAPNIGKVDASKYTPQSMQQFAISGDYGSLVPRESDTSLAERLSTEEGLRKEFTKVSGDYRELAQKMTNIQAAAQNPSAAGDLSIVFSYMKILDPTSVVREGEQATARNAAGVPERVRNIWNRVNTGEQLTPEQRDDFVSQAQSLFAARRQEQAQLIKQYTDIATRAGVNVQNVVLDAFRPAEAEGWKVRRVK